MSNQNVQRVPGPLHCGPYTIECGMRFVNVCDEDGLLFVRVHALSNVDNVFESQEATEERAEFIAASSELFKALKPLAAFSGGIGKMGNLAWSKKNNLDGELYGANWDGAMHTITQADIIAASDAIAKAEGRA